MASSSTRSRVVRSSANAPRATRHAQPAKSYQELSSDESNLFSTEEESDASEKAPITTRRTRGSTANARPKRGHQPSPSPVPSDNTEILYEAPKKRQRVSRAVTRASSAVVKRVSRPSNKRPNRVPEVKHAANTIPLDPYSKGIIPPWATLPYQILVQIFQYAAIPLYDDRSFHPMPSVRWLLDIRRTCAAFQEPALTVLYRSPPLVPMQAAHELARLLKSDPEPMSFNYRAKIETLQIEVSQTASYTLSGYGLLDLHALIYNCPRLSALEFYHEKDLSPYRQLEENLKWSYVDTIFSALENNVEGVATRLKSWRWSSRLAGKKIPIESLLEMHSKPYFSSLEKLAFVNYQQPKLKKTEEDPEHDVKLAASLAPLKKLRHLILESSTLVNSSFMALLPSNIEHLEVINCWEITSLDLSTYLFSHGSQLRSLTLNHNHSLNLSFLTTLKSSCPKLLSLKMDLTYFSVHSTYRNAEPIYEGLLFPDDIPTWPSTLQSIELLQLRGWDISTAQMFFQSLLDSAGELPVLRRLVIKGILNTGWRDRVSFRKEWIEPFEPVFKRVSDPPNPRLMSKGAFEAWKKSTGTTPKKESDPAVQELADSRSRRRVTIVEHVHSSDEETHSRQKVQDRSSSQPDTETTLVDNTQQKHKRLSSELKWLAKTSGPDGREALGRNAIAPPTPLLVSPKRNTGRKLAKHELSILRQTAGDHRPKYQEDSDSASESSESPKQPSSATQSNPDDPDDGDAKNDDDDDDDDDKPLASRKGKEKATQRQQRHRKQIIQGMCNVVDVKIDNLRPAETQFKESDFLDSEPEGDEDWDGTADIGADGYAW
jgi:hypothetical protein